MIEKCPSSCLRLRFFPYWTPLIHFDSSIFRFIILNRNDDNTVLVPYIIHIWIWCFFLQDGHQLLLVIYHSIDHPKWRIVDLEKYHRWERTVLSSFWFSMTNRKIELAKCVNGVQYGKNGDANRMRDIFQSYSRFSFSSFWSTADDGFFYQKSTHVHLWKILTIT